MRKIKGENERLSDYGLTFVSGRNGMSTFSLYTGNVGFNVIMTSTFFKL
ncbi:hypothetical protein [Methanomethylovorans sp.]